MAASVWWEVLLILAVNLIISFAAGCATEKESYIKALKTPEAMLICLVVQFMVRPAAVYGLVLAAGLGDKLCVGFLLCSMAPGGNGSNLLEIIFGGNIELGIVCTLFSSVAAAICIPVDFFIYARQFSEDTFTVREMPWSDLFAAICCVFFGAVAGAFVRYRNDALGEFLEKKTAVVGVILLVGAVVVAVRSPGVFSVAPSLGRTRAADPRRSRRTTERSA